MHINKEISSGSQDIGQNVHKYAGLVWLSDFWHNLLNISRPSVCACAVLELLAQAGRFEYHEPYKWNTFFFS